MTIKDIKFWLDEADLKTPIHDEMVLWTYNNTKNILEKLKLFPSLIIDDKSGKLKDETEVAEKVKEFDILFKLKQQGIEYDKIIEYPIAPDSRFIQGYIDLMVKIKDTSHYGRYLNLKIGCDRLPSFAFEIKPAVRSIGEVLRQFQYYKNFLGVDCKIILVTQTEGLKQIFESQGFYVVQYKKEEETHDG